MKKATKRILDLLSFIDNSQTAYQATEREAELLDKADFTEILPEEHWDLCEGKSYYTKVDGTALIAFRTGHKPGFNIIGSHNDSPCFRVKDNASVNKEGLSLLNVEPYGGAIFRTWLDRPLSIAGRVILKGKNEVIRKNFNIDRDLMIIPSLAIHMDREVNKEGTIKPQKIMLPIYGTAGEKEPAFYKLISKELNLNEEDILGTDAFLYTREKGTIFGENEEFFSVGRIDNLAMAHASLVSLIESEAGEKTNIVAITNNEEVGSQTLSGADSFLIRDALERISLALGFERADFLLALKRSFVISADGAHAVHPAHPDVCDPTNRPKLNEGPVIKFSAGKSYSTVAETAAKFSLLAKKASVKIQSFYNHSDRRGGSTIGPMTESMTGIPTVDVGNAMLGMHSARETAGVKDHEAIIKIFKEFYK